jgi:hypothetical protein
MLKLFDQLESRLWIYDIECYPNWWGVGFRRLTDGQVVQFTSDDPADSLIRWMQDHEDIFLIGFNNHFYDDPVLKGMLEGCTVERVFEIGDGLIKGTMTNYQKRSFVQPVGIGTWRTVDLMNTLGIEGLSLKEIGVRLHHPLVWCTDAAVARAADIG